MLGVILTSLGTLFTEIGDLIGKAQARQGSQDAYAMGFFNSFWAGILFLGIVLYKWEFNFSLASLPTFGLRMILEVLQAHFSVRAIIIANRSTFGFIRVLTLPLLLSVDFFLGYTISVQQLSGIVLIVLTLIFIFLSAKMDRQGRWIVLFTALNAVITISLYKYDITHFNSVATEQLLFFAILLVYFWAAGMYWTRENSLRLLFSNRVFLVQSLAQGLGGVVESFAYPFAPASIIIAAKRSSATAWSVISGRFVFSEKNFLFKLTVLVLLVAGIILLVI